MAANNSSGYSFSRSTDPQENSLMQRIYQEISSEDPELMLEAVEGLIGPQHLELAERLDDLAECEFGNGRLLEAEALWWMVLVIRQKVLGPIHKDVALSLSTLGELYESQGKISEAASTYRQALEIMECNLEPGHPNLAIAVQRLADVYVMQGDFPEADRLY